MANRILVSVQDGISAPSWLDESKIGEFAAQVLKKLGVDREEVSLLFCDDAAIQRLNRDYRSIDSPTDILSFENGSEYTDEEGGWLQAGDIVVSLETLPKNAVYFKVSENEELKRLLIHGLLHLNGYDHGEEHIGDGDAPKGEMLVLQERLLREFEEVVLAE